MMFGQASTPMSKPVEIDLRSGPSEIHDAQSHARRGSYILSLVLHSSTERIAHNHKAEKVMIPALDILQSIPVLGFLRAWCWR